MDKEYRIGHDWYLRESKLKKMVRYLTISGYLTNEQIRVVDPDSFERGFLVVSSCNYIYQI